MVDRVKCCSYPSSMTTKQNLVAVSHTVCELVGLFFLGGGTLGPLRMGRGWPLETRYSRACGTIPNFVALDQNVWAYAGIQKWETLGPAPGWGRGWPPRNMLIHYLYYHAKFGHSRSNRSKVIIEICQNISIPHAPPFKVTQGHWNPSRSSGFYDFY